MNSEKISEFKSLLDSSNSIVITTHYNPDGDAIGSVLGLYHALAGAGYRVKAVTTNGFPEFLSWMPGQEKVVRFSESKAEASELLRNADTIICLDFNGFKRTETMSDVITSARGKKVLIDHHPDPDPTFDLLFSTTQVSSTAEMVYEILTAAFGSQVIGLDSAVCLFAGIMTDTGSFSYGIFSRTFQVAGELIPRGVNVEAIQGLVYNNFSSDRMRLLGHALNQRMKVFPDHKAAYISLTRSELKSFNYRIGDTEGFVNYPLSIKGIIFSVLFVEYDSFIKVSLRSRGSFAVNEVAQKYYKGGGHRNAAGGKAFMSLTETEREFEEILATYSEVLNAN